MKKNQNFLSRLRNALHGVSLTFRQEQSFRTQVVFAILAIGVLILLQARPQWWAIFILLITAILALELINTSLENLLDRLHPEHHEKIGMAKDCAAGAVLLMSISSLIIFFVFLFEKLFPTT